MITTRLWHALRDVSVYDPVYRRAVSPEKLPMRRSLPLILRLGLVALLFVGFCGGISLAPDLVWGVVFSVLAVIPIVYIAFNGTLSGIGWASHIALNIHHERERGAYHLLSTMPKGAAGTSWTLCAATLSRDGAFGNEDSERVWILRTMFGIAVLFALVIWASRPRGWDITQDQTVTGLVNIVALLVAFRIDDIQSVVTSGLVGMLVPTFGRDTVDTRLWAIGLFLAAQIGGYLLTGIVGFVLLPRLMAWTNVPPFYAEIVLAFLRLGAFFAIRESINRALWVALARRFDTTATEMYQAVSG